MSQILKNGKDLFLELFAKSSTPISEKLTTEEFATFKAELEEARSQIAAQTDGNTKLKADYDAAITRAETAEGKVKDLEPKLTEASTKISTLTTENERLGKWFNEHKGAVNGTNPNGDQSQSDGDPISQFKEGSVMHAALSQIKKK
jgi:chromosome segregation ATPase